MITEHELPCNSLKPHKATGVPFIQQAALSWVSLPSCPGTPHSPYLSPMPFTFILPLIGVEVIFFTVAIMGPCLQFVLETVLITQAWGSSVAEQHLHSVTSTEAGVHKNLGEHTPGIGDPSSPKGYPHTI